MSYHSCDSLLPFSIAESKRISSERNADGKGQQNLDFAKLGHSAPADSDLSETNFKYWRSLETRALEFSVQFEIGESKGGGILARPRLTHKERPKASSGLGILK